MRQFTYFVAGLFAISSSPVQADTLIYHCVAEGESNPKTLRIDREANCDVSGNFNMSGCFYIVMEGVGTTGDGESVLSSTRVQAFCARDETAGLFCGAVSPHNVLSMEVKKNGEFRASTQWQRMDEAGTGSGHTQRGECLVVL